MDDTKPAWKVEPPRIDVYGRWAFEKECVELITEIADYVGMPGHEIISMCQDLLRRHGKRNTDT